MSHLGDHLAEVHHHSLGAVTEDDQRNLEVLHDDQHKAYAHGKRVGFDPHNHDLVFEAVPFGVVLHDHLATTHDDLPDGSFGPEEWEAAHLYQHQHPGGAWYQHRHEGMVVFPYPIEQLPDHLVLTHLDREYEGQPSDRTFDNIVTRHDVLHLEHSARGVPHEHRADGTHLVEVGHRVGDPVPRPVVVPDEDQALPEIEPRNRRLVLVAAGEFESLIEVRRKMLAALEEAMKAQREVERLYAKSDQHFRVLERLAIHPKHLLPLLAPGEAEWAHAETLGDGFSLYAVVENLVVQAAAKMAGIAGLPDAHPEVTFDPRDEESPGSHGTDGDTSA